MSFDESDASGWDECLPSVAACQVETEAGTAAIPDHGDLWRVPWQVVETTADSVTMRARCFSIPLELTRSLLLLETPAGWQLQLLYTLANRGAERVPWSWAAHPLFHCEPGDRIVLPPDVAQVRLEGSRGGRLGPGGIELQWPVATLADGARHDLSLVHAAATGWADKLFTGALPAGWAVLERPSISMRITVRFDPTVTPYLGLWLCYGGWPEGDTAKQVCVALEPATAPVDSLAETGAWSRWLAPGETISWPMEVTLERNSNHA